MMRKILDKNFNYDGKDKSVETNFTLVAGGRGGSDFFKDYWTVIHKFYLSLYRELTKLFRHNF